MVNQPGHERFPARHAPVMRFSFPPRVICFAINEPPADAVCSIGEKHPYTLHLSIVRVETAFDGFRQH